MKHQTPIIVLTGGGSGGHITPLLSLARELKSQRPGCEILYIGHKGDDLDTFKESGHDFDFMAFIKAGKFRRYHNVKFASGVLDLKTLILNIRDFFRLPGSIVAAWRLLRKFNPDVVFSKGGFVAVPVGIAAKMRGIPIVTHDSDSLPGLANRIIGRWAKIHATGMPARYYLYPERSIKHVGIPIDERIKTVTPKLQAETKQKLKLPKDSRVILLSGGGNGSQRLNELMLSVAPELLQTNLGLYLIHLAGISNEEDVKSSYALMPEPLHDRVRVFGFSSDFYSYSAAADLVIARAGATTMAELAAAAKACIVIPSPFLAGGHQIKNAEELAAHDAIVQLPEETTPDELLALINSLLSNDSRRFELASNLHATAKPGASKNLAALILKIAG
ncbi:MAG TPA: UDP-N-acetylglucosamine--N-acetylmuramyl-(pentapeptide) pyrophosphoryl-undecaprenol N-acetylglucosamine transferase [Candidatus Babeliales bacterium]|nr:UDP-N-acetylglucosamine--N-acetylmuramyl-(pentapeptide) pyrophosphoryl-undecaprenol N-acetylglucosamine transferase [Candidatus Babeliales bacterium]